MSEASMKNMVLRTVYLPLETDRELRSLAFTRGNSKGELIRDLIRRGLDAIRQAGELSLAERVSDRAKAKAAAAKSPTPVKRRKVSSKLPMEKLVYGKVESPARHIERRKKVKDQELEVGLSAKAA